MTWLGGDESTTAAASASKGAFSVSSACRHTKGCWEYRCTDTSKRIATRQLKIFKIHVR